MARERHAAGLRVSPQARCIAAVLCVCFIAVGSDAAGVGADDGLPIITPGESIVDQTIALDGAWRKYAVEGLEPDRRYGVRVSYLPTVACEFALKFEVQFENRSSSFFEARDATEATLPPLAKQEATQRHADVGRELLDTHMEDWIPPHAAGVEKMFLHISSTRLDGIDGDHATVRYSILVVEKLGGMIDADVIPAALYCVALVAIVNVCFLRMWYRHVTGYITSS